MAAGPPPEPAAVSRRLLPRPGRPSTRALTIGVIALVIYASRTVSPQPPTSTIADFNGGTCAPHACFNKDGPAVAFPAGGPTDSSGKFLRPAFEAAPIPSHNTIAFNRSAVGAYDVIVADFDFRLTPLDTRADGLGFALLNTAAYGIDGAVNPPDVAENPNFTNSIGVAFDIWEPDGDFDNDVVIHFNGTERAKFDVTEDIDLAGGRWIHARVILRPGGGLQDVTVILTPVGGTPRIVVNQYQVAGFTPYEGRAYFGARSGGESADHDLDNVNVSFHTAAQSLVSFATLLQSPLESTSTATIEVQRSLNTAATVTVQYETVDLTATSPSDYPTTTGTVTFAPGDTTESISVPLVNDGTQEIAEERFLVRLFNATGATLGGPITTAVRIMDDDDGRIRGQWNLPIDLPVIPIHLHLLPNGELLFYEGRGESHDQPMFTEIRKWNPITGAVTHAALPGFDVFCSGHSLLPNGSLFVAGGHVDGDNGLPHATVYVPERDAWVQLADMNAPRWYPTNTTLGNGDVLVTGGNITSTPEPAVRNTLPQVFDLSRWTWRSLTGADMAALWNNPPSPGGELYPRMFLAPDGRVFKAGPDLPTAFLDTSGAGSWTAGPARLVANREYGAAVMYDSTVVHVGGGGQDPASAGPTATAELLDLNNVGAGWISAGTMQFARRHLNATLLPTGQVLVTGGTATAGPFNAAGAVLAAELWTPPSSGAPAGTWTTLAPMSIKRVYHSTALLLPDGRVVSGGAGQPNSVGDVDHKNVEIFSPPYLFNGPRPTITSAPASAKYGETFSIQTPDAATISRISMIRLGSVTHAFDQNQRLVTLPFSQGSGVLNVTVPANPNTAPPGHYMVFILKGDVPSVAAILRVHGFTNDPVMAATTIVRAVHVSELRSRVNLLRVRYGLAPFSWTDPLLSAGATPVRAVHFTDLRTALADAYTAAGQAPPTYSATPPLGLNQTISAVHVNELRVRVAGLQ